MIATGGLSPLEGFMLKKDYDIHTAVDGQDALEILGLFNFDLIISDLNMPNIDGTQLARKLRSKGIQTPIVLMSGGLSKDSLMSALRLEISDLLEKPVKLVELKKCITKTLQLQAAKENNQGRLVGLLQVTRENNRD